jgi:hypothetical protein
MVETRSSIARPRVLTNPYWRSVFSCGWAEHRPCKAARQFREKSMSLTSGSKPLGGDRIIDEDERQRDAARSVSSLPDDVESEGPEGSVPDPAGVGTTAPPTRIVVASLPERYAELRASGLVCGRW